MIAKICAVFLMTCFLSAQVHSATPTENYKELIDEAHALIDQEFYVASAAKFVLAATLDIKSIWKASALYNAGMMFKLAGKTSTEINELLDQAVTVLSAEEASDKTVVLIKARISRVKKDL